MKVFFSSRDGSNESQRLLLQNVHGTYFYNVLKTISTRYDDMKGIFESKNVVKTWHFDKSIEKVAKNWEII